jgi:N-acetylneuraminic acid mutarotase
MHGPRRNHRATLLGTGQVLVTGGDIGSNYISMVEYYGAIGTWSIVGTNALAAREGHTATLLPNGKVLLAGGINTNAFFTNAALFDPTFLSWTNTGPMNTPRMYHTATLLSNGKVLVVGGATSGSNSIPDAELFDPASGTWALTSQIPGGRSYHTSTLLPNGQVLVAGGYQSGSGFVIPSWLYDPATATWGSENLLIPLRYNHTATLLPNGKVLVTGGGTHAGITSRCDLFDPATGLWTQTGSLNAPRAYHTATLLPNGKVLVTGGEGTNSIPDFYLSSAELYDPTTGTWTTTGSMNLEHSFDTATLMPGGKVLVAGGVEAFGHATNSCELYDIGLGYSFFSQPQIANGFSQLALGNGLILSGSGFRGQSEGSGGNNSQDSPADYPVTQLRSTETERTLFLMATNWNTNSVAFGVVNNFPPGLALATVFVNGIPSAGSLVNVAVPIPTPPLLTNPKLLTNGSFQFGFTNSVGALFVALASTNITLPSSNWTVLGGVTEIAPGQFQFTDLYPWYPGGSPKSFYRVRSP